MYNRNAYLKQYQLSNVMTASPLMLIIMLYDEAIRTCSLAKEEIHNRNKEGTHNRLVKAQKIITELTVSLNMEAGGEIAENLKSIYVYLHMRLVEANVENSVMKIDECLKILSSLRAAWQDANTANRRSMVEQNRVSLST